MLIKNCSVYNNEDGQLKDILITNGKIAAIENKIELQDETVYDAEGKIIIPGLIEVHIQGAGGADILDGTEESILTMSGTLARLGTTSFLGATVVKPLEDNAHLRKAKEYVNKELNGANLLGFHLEGPFINPVKKGGLAPDGIYDSTPQKLKEIFDVLEDTLKMMTIAPEMPGNLEIIAELAKNKVVPAFAHSNATYEETKKGFDAGISHVTHIFNAMPPIQHRTPGPLAAIFERPEITAQIISDGHHLHPSIVNIVYRMLGVNRCVCITDGMQAMGLPDGRYIYNGKPYSSIEGAAKYDDGTLIGSTMSLLDIAFKFKSFTNCSFAEAINTVTLVPAKTLGIEKRKGRIAVNADADLVILNNDNTVNTTFVNGKAVYKN
jgi:N-acetylglucosamine-6-phosphate deacetylase